MRMAMYGNFLFNSPVKYIWNVYTCVYACMFGEIIAESTTQAFGDSLIRMR